jgi:hypothetical protein
MIIKYRRWTIRVNENIVDLYDTVGQFVSTFNSLEEAKAFVRWAKEG